MGRKTVVVAPTLPASAKLSRFHGDATDSPLYSIVTWTSRHGRGASASVVRKRQLALEPASRRLLELQRVGASSDKNRSWFVGSGVQQDGSLVMLTPMDPLFVLLHAVVDQKERYLSTYDLLSRDQNTWWFQLGPTITQTKIELICDVQYTGDEAIDNLYVRANETKILQWLETKAKRVARVLAESAAKADSARAFDAKFALPGQEAAKPEESASVVEGELTPEQIARYHRDAVDVIGDYIPSSLVPTLIKHLNITVDSAAPASTSNASEPLDAIRRFDRRAAPEPAGSTPSKRTAAPANNSATKKKSKLANVDRSGMKSISSFFGKK